MISKRKLGILYTENDSKKLKQNQSLAAPVKTEFMDGSVIQDSDIIKENPLPLEDYDVYVNEMMQNISYEDLENEVLNRSMKTQNDGRESSLIMKDLNKGKPTVKNAVEVIVNKQRAALKYVQMALLKLQGVTDDLLDLLHMDDVQRIESSSSTSSGIVLNTNANDTSNNEFSCTYDLTENEMETALQEQSCLETSNLTHKTESLLSTVPEAKTISISKEFISYCGLSTDSNDEQSITSALSSQKKGGTTKVKPLANTKHDHHKSQELMSDGRSERDSGDVVDFVELPGLTKEGTSSNPSGNFNVINTKESSDKSNVATSSNSDKFVSSELPKEDNPENYSDRSKISNARLITLTSDPNSGMFIKSENYSTKEFSPCNEFSLDLPSCSKIKDHFGTPRGGCKLCECPEYLLSISSNLCDYCGHYPINHRSLGAPGSIEKIVKLISTCRETGKEKFGSEILVSVIKNHKNVEVMEPQIPVPSEVINLDNLQPEENAGDIATTSKEETVNISLPEFSQYVLPYLQGSVTDVKAIAGMRNQIIRELIEHLNDSRQLINISKVKQSWGYRKLGNAILLKYPNIIKERPSWKRNPKGTLGMLISRLADRRRKQTKFCKIKTSFSSQERQKCS